MVNVGKEWVSWFMTTVECTKVYGKMTGDMARVSNVTLIKTPMKVTFLEVKLMDKEFTNGKMGRFMKENG